MNILVVPTIRENCIKEFLSAWCYGNNWDSVIVVEDNPEKSFKLPEYCIHYSWQEIEDQLGKNSWIISKRDSAIRSFGFYAAYMAGADIIFTLDDDCYPIPPMPHEHTTSVEKFIHSHIEAFTANRKWTELVPKNRSRGIPYRNKGQLEVDLNVGLWEGVPDLDAIQSLSNQRFSLQNAADYRIIPNGQYFPMCGMNMAFKRKMTPLMYFPLMGKDSPYSRFDDIWCGVIMKKVADHLRINVSCGNPRINHRKASDPFVNLVKEAPGVVANETFWEAIDKIDLQAYNPVHCMKQIGLELQKESDTYIQRCGEAIGIWASLFES